MGSLARRVVGVDAQFGLFMTPSGPRALAIIGDLTGPAYWRCLSPMTALMRQGYPCRWARLLANDLADHAMWADVVILNRISWERRDWAKAVAWVETFHQFGKTVLYETDDDLFSELALPQLERHQPDHTPAQMEAERQARIFALRLCDGVTVTVPRLATLVRQYTDAPVVVVPNAIDWDTWRTVCSKGTRPAPGLTIGWAGGLRAEHDVAPMAEAWGRIAATHPTVTFVCVGHQPEAIRAAVPTERLVRIPWVPLSQYPVGYHGIDIFCCPLIDKPFNRTKSNIKAQEAAAAGATVVFSPTVYAQHMRDGIDGLEATTADEWTAALARLVNDAALRQRLGARWAKTVRERHSLAVNLFRWTDAWQALRTAPRRTLVGVG